MERKREKRIEDLVIAVTVSKGQRVLPDALRDWEKNREIRGKTRIRAAEKEMMGKDERGCVKVPFGEYLKVPDDMNCCGVK